MQFFSSKEFIVGNEKAARETILTSSKTGYLLINGDLEALYHTPAASHLLGDTDTQPCHPDAIVERLELDKASFHRIQRSIMNNGFWEGHYTRSERHLNVVVSPAGKTVHISPEEAGIYLVEIRDCTKEFMHLQKAREQHTLDTKAEKIRSEILSQVNHDFKTPLHAIIGYSEHILAECDARPEHQTYISEILHASNNLLNAVNELIESSQENNDFTIHVEPLEIRELVEECVALLTPLAESFGGMEMEIVGDELMLCSDRLRLKQVILALASNAIRHNNRPGKVSIRITELHQKLQIQVVDSGPGIPESMKASLFTLSLTQGTGSGTSCRKGMGLMICRRLLQQLHGELAFVSLTGVGSLFSVTLPLKRPQLIKNSDNPVHNNVRLLWVGGDKKIDEFGKNLSKLQSFCQFERLKNSDRPPSPSNQDTSLLVIKDDKFLQNNSLAELLKYGNILVVNAYGIIETAAGAGLDKSGNYTNCHLDMTLLTKILEDLSRK